MYYCCGITEKGVMPHNEDAIIIGERVMNSGVAEMHLDVPFIAAVSDGVSGELSGELASMLCLNSLRSLGKYDTEGLKEGIMNIHHDLAEYSRSHADARNMQATLCGIAVDSSHNIVTYNVGDSRLYRFRDGQVRQLSRDQSLVQLLYEEGSITREEKKTHSRRNIIFPVLGNAGSDPTVDAAPLEGGMEYGDVLIMCTDGLSDYVSSMDMQEILELPKSLFSRLEMMVDLALERKCNDNISVIALIYTDPGIRD
ncbi:MAG TPA: serine/threonine-protein phosphatase [Ruminococcus sp.]|nr:serine/threonine-protein phosphatase [Ruminococcus sp.]